VAHVVGAGNAMDANGLLHLADQATITKMIRVMMLAPVLLIMSYVLSKTRRNRSTDASQGKKTITIPWFAFGFILIIIINSLLGSVIPSDYLNGGRDIINNVDNFLLTMAMTALGTETNIEKFKKAGAKPFLLAGIIYVWLLGGGYLLCKYLV